MPLFDLHRSIQHRWEGRCEVRKKISSGVGCVGLFNAPLLTTVEPELDVVLINRPAKERSTTLDKRDTGIGSSPPTSDLSVRSKLVSESGARQKFGWVMYC